MKRDRDGHGFIVQYVCRAYKKGVELTMLIESCIRSIDPVLASTNTIVLYHDKGR